MKEELEAALASTSQLITDADIGTGKWTPDWTKAEWTPAQVQRFSAVFEPFPRIVLSCINADFCVQRLIFQSFFSSTFFFRTTPDFSDF